ncbi:hypothetical protein ABT142_33605 [Streptomyces sp. NPDC001857]|uniref:hypothetical protein n=1 Tax=unclassified Streptomyces TaxID=2593676 RepID=UPI0033290E44
MRTLVLGRTPARVTEVLATLHADGFDAEGVSTDEEARKLLETDEFGVLIVGGGVEPDSVLRSRSSRQSTGAAGDRRRTDGAVRRLRAAGVRAADPRSRLRGVTAAGGLARTHRSESAFRPRCETSEPLRTGRLVEVFDPAAPVLESTGTSAALPAPLALRQLVDAFAAA